MTKTWNWNVYFDFLCSHAINVIIQMAFSLPPNTTESIRLYALRSLSSSIRGGGRVSTSIGGWVTGSTPQKSSVNWAAIEQKKNGNGLMCDLTIIIIIIMKQMKCVEMEFNDAMCQQFVLSTYCQSIEHSAGQLLGIATWADKCHRIQP